MARLPAKRLRDLSVSFALSGFNNTANQFHDIPPIVCAGAGEQLIRPKSRGAFGGRGAPRLRRQNGSAKYSAGSLAVSTPAMTIVTSIPRSSDTIGWVLPFAHTEPAIAIATTAATIRVRKKP